MRRLENDEAYEDVSAPESTPYCRPASKYVHTDIRISCLAYSSSPGWSSEGGTNCVPGSRLSGQVSSSSGCFHCLLSKQVHQGKVCDLRQKSRRQATDQAWTKGRHTFLWTGNRAASLELRSVVSTTRRPSLFNVEHQHHLHPEPPISAHRSYSACGWR